MQFSGQIGLRTREFHSEVDKHPFIKLIDNHEKAGDLYINLNKLCILSIQKHIDSNSENFSSFQDLFNKLYRQIGVVDMVMTPNLQLLTARCTRYPIQHAYMFYVGLLFGGSLLSKKLPKHAEFLTFQDKSNLIKEFRSFLDTHVTEEKNQGEFINIVNESYQVIKSVFDDMYISVNDK